MFTVAVSAACSSRGGLSWQRSLLWWQKWGEVSGAALAVSRLCFLKTQAQRAGGWVPGGDQCLEEGGAAQMPREKWRAQAAEGRSQDQEWAPANAVSTRQAQDFLPVNLFSAPVRGHMVAEDRKFHVSGIRRSEVLLCSDGSESSLSNDKHYCSLFLSHLSRFHTLNRNNFQSITAFQENRQHNTSPIIKKRN